MLHRTGTLPDMPMFSNEERARINKVYKEYRDKYDPATSSSFAMRGLPREESMDLAKKIRDAERVAGW